MNWSCPGGGTGRRGRFKTCSSGEGSSPSRGTMNNELREKFKKTLTQFVRENGIKMSDPEFVKLIRNWFEYLSHYYKNDNTYSEDFNQDTPAYQKLRMLHESIVSQCIEFIRLNEDVQQMIEEKRDLVRKEWNKPDDTEIIEPDVRMYFGIDGLDDSVNAGYWTSGSDSSMTLKVGSTNVLDIC